MPPIVCFLWCLLTCWLIMLIPEFVAGFLLQVWQEVSENCSKFPHHRSWLAPFLSNTLTGYLLPAPIALVIFNMHGLVFHSHKFTITIVYVQFHWLVSLLKLVQHHAIENQSCICCIFSTTLQLYSGHCIYFPDYYQITCITLIGQYVRKWTCRWWWSW